MAGAVRPRAIPWATTRSGAASWATSVCIVFWVACWRRDLRLDVGQPDLALGDQGVADDDGQQAADHQEGGEPQVAAPGEAPAVASGGVRARRPAGRGGGSDGPGWGRRWHGGRYRRRAGPSGHLAVARRRMPGREALDHPQAGRLGPAVAGDLGLGGPAGAAVAPDGTGDSAPHTHGSPGGQWQSSVAARERRLHQAVLAGVVRDDHAPAARAESPRAASSPVWSWSSSSFTAIRMAWKTRGPDGRRCGGWRRGWRRARRRRAGPSW